MLFNSYEFILAFLPLSLLGFFVIGTRFGREPVIYWLVLMSLFFYAWWNPVYLIFIVFSMIFNFMVGRYLFRYRNSGRPGIATTVLVIGIVVNLGFLGYFKYANFFIDNVNQLFGEQFSLGTIVLPLAISFFTFQQITFLVDSRQGHTEEYKFSHYALFVTFFPQLIAGPIVHHGEILPQFMRTSFTPVAKNIAVGLTIFSIGLVKKTVFADGVAVYSSPVFSAADQGHALTFFTAWGGALAYTMQLYFDFSGYSDMAIGAARLFGIRLPLNFNSPYKAASISEFWRRWHITLSRFLRDYLYIALGGNRKGRLQRYINLFITMLLGGLWHGAGWTFVIWGGLHGFYLIVNHGWRFARRKIVSAGASVTATSKGASWLLTFMAVVLGWVFFRAENMHTAIEMLRGMLGLNGVAIPNAITARLGSLGTFLESMGVRSDLGGGELGGGSVFVATYLWVTVLFVIAMFMPNTQEMLSRHEPALETYANKPDDAILVSRRLQRYMTWDHTRRWAVLTALASTAGILSLSKVSEFLYFQF